MGITLCHMARPLTKEYSKFDYFGNNSPPSSSRGKLGFLPYPCSKWWSYGAFLVKVNELSVIGICTAQKITSNSIQLQSLIGRNETDWIWPRGCHVTYTLRWHHYGRRQKWGSLNQLQVWVKYIMSPRMVEKFVLGVVLGILFIICFSRYVLSEYWHFYMLSGNSAIFFSFIDVVDKRRKLQGKIQYFYAWVSLIVAISKENPHHKLQVPVFQK